MGWIVQGLTETMMGMWVAALLLAGVQAEAGEAAKARDAGSERVCRRGKETGSRLRAKRVCRTRDEWRELDAAAARTLDNSRTMSRPTG